MADRDDVDLLIDCIQAVTDLMIPVSDLHMVDRDKLAILMLYLSDRLVEAVEQVRNQSGRSAALGAMG